jgi:hypothetical protein
MMRRSDLWGRPDGSIHGLGIITRSMPGPFLLRVGLSMMLRQFVLRFRSIESRRSFIGDAYDHAAPTTHSNSGDERDPIF